MNVGTVLPRGLAEEMTTSYMDYAMSVIISRALPDVRDGLKPVQRRIMFAMHQMGLTSGARHRKCAGIVGEVLKNFHPHSDTAVYDALVRLAQDFSMRYPLIDGQGNFGSVDGDSAAAMRYTEARMSAIAAELVADIDKDTVDFVDNYDASMKEPVLLPIRIPNLLLNGSSGIAVGMTTNIPPHNLREVAAGIIHLLENPEATSEELGRFVKGPDFPTGGVIIGTEGIKAAYATGHGRIVVRARVRFEEAPSGRERIIVEELPYQVNKAHLIAKIADLVSDRQLEGIADLNDESDRHGMRILIELRRDARPHTVLNNLYKHTQLQTTFGVIMLALVDGRPQILGLKRMLQLFIEHRKTVIIRRTTYDLARARERAHILEGLKVCLDHLDEVIRMIRNSKDVEVAQQGLMGTFGLSVQQAKAILEMRLQRLTGLERQKIIEEYEEVIRRIAYFEDLLASENKVVQLIKDEQEELVKKYADDRRTEINPDASVVLTEEDLIPKEEVVVTLTHRGYIKRQPSRSFRNQTRGGKGSTAHRPTEGGAAPTGNRESDYAEHLLITHTHASMLFFTNRGRVFQLRVHEVPDRERQARGLPINNLIDLDRDERVTSVYSRPEEESGRYMVMATRRGYIKKTALKEYANVRRNGLIAINLQSGDELNWVAASSDDEDLIIATRLGRAIRFRCSEVRAMGRDTMGVIGVRLVAGDVVAGMCVARADGDLLVITERGYGKRTSFVEYPLHHRAGQGVFTLKVTERVGGVAALWAVSEPSEEILVISSRGMVLRTVADSISRIGRQTQGVIVMRVSADDQVVGIAPVGALME